MGLFLGKFVFLPKVDAPKNALVGLEWHSYQLNDESKEVPLKFYSCPNASAPTIIYSHGNQDDLESIDQLVSKLAEEIECNFLTYEYPGYGYFKKPQQILDVPLSPPIEHHCSEAGCNDAIRGAYDFLIKKKGTDPKQIYLWGMSLGTGPSVDLASDDKFPVGGMILQSGFLSILRIPIHLAVSLNFVDMFTNIDKLPKITCPLALIHGENDKTIPVSHSHEMMKLVKFSPFLRIPGGEHNLFENPEHYFQIVKFVKELIVVMANRNAKTPPVETKEIQVQSIENELVDVIEQGSVDHQSTEDSGSPLSPVHHEEDIEQPSEGEQDDTMHPSSTLIPKDHSSVYDASTEHPLLDNNDFDDQPEDMDDVVSEVEE